MGFLGPATARGTATWIEKEIRRIARFTFADQQSNEETWYNSAVSFYEGAKVLGRNKDSIRGGSRVYALNAALSIELLLKAIIVAKKEKAGKSHRLADLAHDAGVAFSKNQEATLELLGEILQWSGRYPVPNKEEDWNHYYEHVFERHEIRERDENTWKIPANRETFPSVENCEKLWVVANRKWDELQVSSHHPQNPSRR